MNRLVRLSYPVLAFLLALVPFSCSKGPSGGGDGRGEQVAALPPAEAQNALAKWISGVRATTLPIQSSGPAVASEAASGVTLPPIESFPLAVDGGPDAAEIFASVDKSGSGPDGWMVEVGRRFNEARVTTSGGRQARVSIRKIDSGTGYEFISTRKHFPDAYSPASTLWIEMCRSYGIRMTNVHAALAGNVAGIVMKSATRERVWPGKKDVGVPDVVDAAIQKKIAVGYTNPFNSATGLNFLITTLQTFAKGNEKAMLSQEVASSFEAFQKAVPFVAMTTPQMRDSVERDGSLDAFVMGYQTFSGAASLKTGYDFIPFGFRHDNPLYAVGDVPREKRDVLDRFAKFCLAEPQKRLAAEYGFWPPIDWKEPYAVPSGKTMAAAQKLWKQRKDAGRPIAAIFVADVSGSMAGSKINMLRNALLDGSQFISSGNAIGLISFSTDVSIHLPIKPFSPMQKAAFQAAARGLDTGGQTAMYDAVAVALSLLGEYRKAHADVRPMVFVLTDGETNTGAKYDESAPIIAGLKIPIYTIGFETQGKELSKLSAIVEAASMNANEQDIRYKIGNLFNAQM